MEGNPGVHVNRDLFHSQSKMKMNIGSCVFTVTISRNDYVNKESNERSPCYEIH